MNPLRVLLPVLILAPLLGGCAADLAEHDYRLNHPIIVEEKAAVALFTRPADGRTLSAADRYRLGRLAEESLRRGAGPIEITVGAKPGSAPIIGGLTAGKDAIQTLKNKTTNAWTAYSLPIVGYSVIDSFARYFTKTPFSKTDLPTQILTQKNIGTSVLTSAGDYLGVKDYEAQFKKVWGM